MKRKAAALAFAVLLVLQAACLPVSAADQVYFTAVNETVLELSDATMPFWSNGRLYVHSSVFSTRRQGSGQGTELGITYSYNSAKGTVVLYNSTGALIFYLNDGTVTDGQGSSREPGALVRGGGIFLPANMVAKFFDLGYTSSAVDNGYLIRFTSQNAVLSDSLFLDAASYQLASRYSQYEKSKETNTSETTTQPGTETVVSGKRIYLCILADDVAKTEKLLNALDHYGDQATFYCTASLLADGASGNLLRRMAASGYGIGLQLGSGDDPDALNELLFRATSGKTRLVRGEEPVAALSAGGYCRLSADLNWASAGLSGSSSATALLKRVTARSGGVSVWLGENVNAVGLSAFLGAAKATGDHLLALNETVG